MENGNCPNCGSTKGYKPITSIPGRTDFVRCKTCKSILRIGDGKLHLEVATSHVVLGDEIHGDKVRGNKRVLEDVSMRGKDFVGGYDIVGRPGRRRLRGCFNEPFNENDARHMEVYWHLVNVGEIDPMDQW